MPIIQFLSGGGSLFGLGVDSIDLNWTPSPSVGVIQYNIYRGTVSGGPYLLIGNAPPYNNGAVLAYVDFGVTRGATYYYVVTAYDGTSESVFSNEASATARV